MRVRHDFSLWKFIEMISLSIYTGFCSVKILFLLLYTKITNTITDNMIVDTCKGKCQN